MSDLNKIRLPTDAVSTTMNRLLILTKDHARDDVDDIVIVQRRDGTPEKFHFVAQLDNLLHYRHEKVPEEEARKLVV